MNATRVSSHVAWPALAAALLLAPPIQGAEVGKILFATDGVRIVDENGEDRPAKQGDLIQPGERVVTGPGALGQVKMIDGGLVGIRPGSSLEFQRPATAIAGAPHVMKLDQGDVRVLNMTFDDRAAPKEFVLKTPDGLVQLLQADSIASLRPVGDGAGAPQQTLVRLSAGEAVASNAAGAAKPLGVNEVVSVSPTELKTTAGTTLSAPPLISSKLQTAQDPLSRTVAGTTPIETTTGPRVPPPSDFPSLGLSSTFDTKGYAGLDVQSSLRKVAPTSPRVEDKYVNPVVKEPIKPSAYTAAVVSVKTQTLPEVVVPPSVSLSPTVTSPGLTPKTSIGSKVFTGTKPIADPDKLKSFKSLSDSGLLLR